MRKNSSGFALELERKKFVLTKLERNCSQCNLLRHCNNRAALKEYWGKPWPAKELCCSGWGPKGTTLLR